MSSQDQESETSNQGEESNHVTCEHAHEPEEHLLCNHAAHELEGLMHGEDKVGNRNIYSYLLSLIFVS